MTCPIIYEFGKKTPHFFLSNFYPCKIVLPMDFIPMDLACEQLGMAKEQVYDSTEHAYQALKTVVVRERELIRGAFSPGEAKRIGGSESITLRKGWDGLKVGVMDRLLEIKFQVPELRQLLLDTSPKMLLEGNYWHDLMWGVCFCAKHQGDGRNVLGKLLMNQRSLDTHE
jgi:ribA/ribD-fused uncharacterized protein